MFVVLSFNDGHGLHQNCDGKFVIYTQMNSQGSFAARVNYTS